ncbi:MAG: hypothetical protein GY871_04375 [Actinomycetales bacterium]|nr:hypothetical protein [Actinomycetales bacterium]
MSEIKTLDLVFERPPQDGGVAGAFVEVEIGGTSLRLGRWETVDGLPTLRISAKELVELVAHRLDGVALSDAMMRSFCDGFNSGWEALSDRLQDSMDSQTAKDELLEAALGG